MRCNWIARLDHVVHKHYKKLQCWRRMKLCLRSPFSVSSDRPTGAPGWPNNMEPQVVQKRSTSQFMAWKIVWRFKVGSCGIQEIFRSHTSALFSDTLLPSLKHTYDLDQSSLIGTSINPWFAISTFDYCKPKGTRYDLVQVDLAAPPAAFDLGGTAPRMPLLGDQMGAMDPGSFGRTKSDLGFWWFFWWLLFLLVVILFLMVFFFLY